MFDEMNYNSDTVKELIKSTYFTQRKEINKGASKLCQEWAFLFKEVGMAAHFQELTGISLIDSFLANVDKKGARLLNFFKCVDAHKRKQVLDALLKQQTEKGPSTGCSEEVIQMVLLLLAHFDEKEEHLFHFVEKTSLAEEVHQHPALLCVVSKLNQTCKLSLPWYQHPFALLACLLSCYLAAHFETLANISPDNKFCKQ